MSHPYIDVEGLRRAAGSAQGAADSAHSAASRLEEASKDAYRAADRIEEATRKLRELFEDGYGGNALKLIELLENMKNEPN